MSNKQPCMTLSDYYATYRGICAKMGFTTSARKSLSFTAGFFLFILHPTKNQNNKKEDYQRY